MNAPPLPLLLAIHRAVFALPLQASRAGVRVASALRVGGAPAQSPTHVSTLPPPPIVIGWVPGGKTNNDDWTA